MEKIKIYNYQASRWDEFEGDFISPSSEIGQNVISFDFDPDIYINQATGEFKIIVYQKDENGNWIEISQASSTAVYETEVTGAFINIDQNGLIANNGAENTAIIDKNGNVTIKGNIEATTGKISGWTIEGQTLKSKNNKIILDADNEKITINSTDVEISSANGIVANKGTIGGWTISSTNLSANSGTIKLTGGLTPKIEVGSNITLYPSKLTINNGAIDIKTASNSVTIDSTGIKATKSLNEYAKLDGSGLTVVGGAVNITTAESGNKKLTITSSGITAQIDANNRVEITGDGVKCIKNGNTIGSAITPDGLIGQLLTDQSVPGSKFDKTPPQTPTVQTLTSQIEQLAEGQFVNIEVEFTSVLDSDREGYKVYLKEGTFNNSSTYFIPIAVLPKDNGDGSTPVNVKYIIRNVKPNTLYTVAVTCFDVTGNESQIQEIKTKSITTIKDTQAPAHVESVTAITGFKMIGIYWPQVTQNWNQTTQQKTGTCTDLDYYKIQRSVNGGSFTDYGISYSTSFIDKDVEYDSYYQYRVIPVDISGNVPKDFQNNPIYKTSQQVYPSRVGNQDIVAHSITTELISIGSVVKSINTKETTLFHFDGTLMSTQGYTPYVEVVNDQKISHQSGFFKKEAKFGASLSIEEDTINLLALATNNNANLKTTTSGWIIGSSTTYVPNNGVDGIDDGYIVVSNNIDTYIDNIDVVPGKKYTISLYASSLNKATVCAKIQPINGDPNKWSYNVFINPIMLVNETETNIINSKTDINWNRYYGSFEIPSDSGVTKIRIYFYTPDAGKTVNIDSVQLEQREYATSFVNGVKPEGYVDYYAPGIINANEGTIAFWIKSIIGWHKAVDNDHPDDSPYIDNWFICGKEEDINSIYARYDRQNSILTVKYGQSTINYIFDNSIKDDYWIHFAYSWKNGEQKLYINGVNVASDNKPSITSFSDILFRLGYFPRRSGQVIIEEYQEGQNKRARASALFDEFRIDKVCRDGNEIKSWFYQDSAFYDASSQIDADTQNISAANASVLINNEGITVKDGKILVESQDGKILLKDGRISVNGLDVGVPQSDNHIYNGNFTVTDTNYSICDIYISEIGVGRFGPKYWNCKRSSPPLLESCKMSVAWNKINLTSYFSDDFIKEIYKTNIDPHVRQIFKYNTLEYITYLFEYYLTVNQSANLYFTTNQSHKTLCISKINNTIQKIFDGISYTKLAMDNEIQNALISAGITNQIAIVYSIGIADYVYDYKDIFIEYNIGVQTTQNDPYITQAAKDECQLVCREAINLFIDNYEYDTAQYIQSQLSTRLIGKTLPNDINNNSIPDEIETLIQICTLTVESNKTYLKIAIEQNIDNKVNELYANLLNYNIGALKYNDNNGKIVTRLFHHDELNGKIYEINADVNNIDIKSIIDPKTGLPIKSQTEFAGGGTSFYVYPNNKMFGRIGYIEIGVHGESNESVEIYQNVAGLTTYTDGSDSKGTNFKQHTFSFNAAWKLDNKNKIIKSNSGKLEFEVEELVPVKPIQRDPNTDMIIQVNGIPIRKHQYYTDEEGNYITSPSLEVIVTDKMTSISDLIIKNTTQNQAVYVGNITIDYITGKYTINSIIDITTLQQPNGPFTHYMAGKGYINNGIWYSSKEYVNTPKWQIVSKGDLKVLETSNVGDFLGIYFNTYTNCDADVIIYQSPENGVGDVILNFKPFNIADFSYTQETAFVNSYKDFKSGENHLLLINRGQYGTSTKKNIISPKIAVIGTKIYDWEPMLAGKDNSLNKVVFEQQEKGKWGFVSITPNYANSVDESGVPILPRMTPIKYKVRIKLSKDNSDNGSTVALITGVQAELGTNPSYTRISYGVASIPGIMIQPYDSTMWLTTGIKTRHLEEYLPWYPGETGIQSRHIANGQITSNKIANSSIVNDHIAKSNISFDKTRIRTIKLKNNSTLNIGMYIPSNLSDIERNYYKQIYSKFISVLPQPQQNVLYVQAPVFKGSETLIKNGVILDEEDDYILSKHIAFIDAKDIFNVAVLYGIVSGIERVLTPNEMANLINVISTTDLYLTQNSSIAAALSSYNVLFTTKIKLLTSTETIQGYTDKYKIIFWEEL